MKAILKKSDPLPPPPSTVVIEMTLDEAQQLRNLVGRINGGSGGAARQVADDLFEALRGFTNFTPSSPWVTAQLKERV